MPKVLSALACAVALVFPGVVRADIVFNGGFETGDFTGWILSGNPIPGNVDSSQPHSGIYGANLFAADTLGYMEQFLSTTPGTLYSLTYFLASDGGVPNEFLAEADGTTLFDQTNTASQAYSQDSFSFMATGTSTDLKLGFRNDPGTLHLDDVSVTPIPEPSSLWLVMFISGLLLFGQRATGYKKERFMKRRIALLLFCGWLCFEGTATVAQAAPPQQRPNILFVILDDVGIDQLRSFGYGGVTTPPRTPVLDTLAHQGIRFRNTWAMPECSPSRAMFFEGRYPLRTNILTAILSTDLANSQVSPFETTTPKILKTANYTSALFGKFHLAGPTNNPYGDGTPNSVGFDYFDGFLEGAPHPIDTTAGGIKVTGGNPALPSGPYSCGFVPAKKDDSINGSDTGACYFADQRACKVITTSGATPTPGRSCLEQGGVFVPADIGGNACHATAPSVVNFNLANGYYVFNLVTNDLQAGTVYKHPLTDKRAREYSPTETTDAAVQWVQSQPANKSWMATVSYAAIHAPYQQAPQALTPGEPDRSGVHCQGGTLGETRILSDQMLEAMDTEIGRLLVETGSASRRTDGSLEYNPSGSNTMVIVIGDNGTYSPSVKAPFDLTHAKGFVNQTGVWVPLIVSGPLVNTPDRDVENMVNVADLFQLFGEIAGLDVRKLVPASRILDSVSMLPYLTNPTQPSLRAYNFTQTGINISAHDARPGPCVLTIPPTGTPIVNTCVQIFPQPGLCVQEGGIWYGPVNGQGGYASCCDLQKATGMNFDILPLAQAAVRNDEFKLIQLTNENCSSSAAPSGSTTSELQFYRITETPVTPLIDFPSLNLIKDPTNPTSTLTPKQAAAFLDLRRELASILNSETDCPGDGNVDGVVDQTDLSNWNIFHKSGSSWYDFNLQSTNGHDGLTNDADRNYIVQNLGRTCGPR